MSDPMDLVDAVDFVESHGDVMVRAGELFRESETAIAVQDPAYCRGCAYIGLLLHNRAVARAWLEQPDLSDDERAFWNSTLLALLAEEIPLHGAKPKPAS